MKKLLLFISLLPTMVWGQSTPTMRQVASAGTAITRLPAASTPTISPTNDTIMVFKNGAWVKAKVGAIANGNPWIPSTNDLYFNSTLGNYSGGQVAVGGIPAASYGLWQGVDTNWTVPNTVFATYNPNHATSFFKVDSKGSIQIKDGTQGSGKILTGDANGVATWSSSVPTSSTFSTVLTNGSNGNSIAITNLGNVTNISGQYETDFFNNFPAYWEVSTNDNTRGFNSTIESSAWDGNTHRPYNKLSSNAVNHSTYFETDSTKIEIDQRGGLFGGITYTAGTSTVVTTNQTQYSLLDRRNGDARWQQIGGFSGVLPIVNGGTNSTVSAINGGVVYSTASQYSITPAGTSGYILQSNGAAAPSFVQPTTTLPTTGTGTIVVLQTSPTLVTPILGTPTSGNLSSCTGLPITTGVSGLANGIATWATTPSSANLASALTDEIGTGKSAFGTALTTCTTCTVTGSGGMFSGTPTCQVEYTDVGGVCTFYFFIDGTSTSTDLSFPIPFTASNNVVGNYANAIAATSAGVNSVGNVYITKNTSTINFQYGPTRTVFGATLEKSAWGMIAFPHQ